ncbi:MAG: hypothetical protein ACI9K5_001377 [Gammaproteobacteria bacterium]|jgi:hypothetical protein
MKNGRRARRASSVLDEWIQELGRRLGKKPRNLPPLCPAGQVHDLTELFTAVLEQDLDPEERARLSSPSLTWGRLTRQARRSLQLGSYDSELGLIRIHPILDQDGVPDWFVRFVLFHEVLHALYPPRSSTGKRKLHHPPEFLAREELHPDHGRANKWQAETIAALLRSLRTGRPLGRRHKRASTKNLLQRFLFD